jgi:hypothetical protein
MPRPYEILLPDYFLKHHYLAPTPDIDFAKQKRHEHKHRVCPVANRELLGQPGQ